MMLKDALVAGLEEVHGEAVGIGDVELFDCAVFLNGRPWRRVDDAGCGVSRCHPLGKASWHLQRERPTKLCSMM
jgi:hypothetical protein